jgi:hypothetical protein
MTPTKGSLMTPMTVGNKEHNIKNKRNVQKVKKQATVETATYGSGSTLQGIE